MKAIGEIIRQYPGIMEQAEAEVLNTPTPQNYNWKADIINLPKEFADKGFKNYVPRNQEEKHRLNAMINFAQNEKKKSLAMLGTYGTGKTHLAVAIMKNHPPVIRKVCTSTESYQGTTEKKYVDIPERATCTFLVVDEFFQELNDCVADHRSKQEIIKNYLNKNDIVCLDDLRTENFTPAKKENLYLFVNRAYLDQKRIIITSNFSLDELESAEPRVASRIAEMCGKWVIEFKGKDYRKGL